jgi:hypothetical protein
MEIIEKMHENKKVSTQHYQEKKLELEKWVEI